MSNNTKGESWTIKPYNELCFTDDFMFRKVLSNDEDLCRRFVELLMDVKIERIAFKGDDYPIYVDSDTKGVRLDVYLADENGTVFDLEMQNEKKRNLPKRARYYQSMIDIDNLMSGANYDELPDSYVVFICTKDPFAYGLHKYSFRECCSENSEIILGSGTGKVFINAAGRREDASDDMKAFLDYLCGEEAKSKLTKDLELGIKAAKGRKSWEVEYMTLYDEIRIERRDAFREGRQEGKLEGVKSLVASGILNAEKACEILGVSVSDYEEYMKDSVETDTDYVNES